MRNAYVIFLPYGVNVEVGDGPTCAVALAYHSYDGFEPDAVIPACGRGGLAISHEVAEMAIDPVAHHDRRRARHAARVERRRRLRAAVSASNAR